MNLKKCQEYFQKEHYQWVADDLTKLIRQDSKNAQLYKLRGDCYQRLKTWDNAIEDYTNAIKWNDKHYIAYNDRGIAYQNLKEYNRALYDYNQAIKLKSDYYKSYNYRGLLYQKLKKYQLALQDFTTAINKNSNFQKAYINRGLIHQKLDKNQLALEDYGKAIQLNNKSFKAYNNRALLYEKMNQNEKAIADYDKALQINQNNEIIYRNRGMAHLKLKKQESSNHALQDYNKAIKINPNFEAAYISRGNIYKNNQQFFLAIEDYTKVTQLNPRHDVAYSNRGIIYSSLGRWNQAIADYNTAIEINPKNYIAYYNRGNTYKGWKKYTLAQADYRKALQTQPQNPFILINLGKCSYLIQKSYCYSQQDKKLLLAQYKQFFKRGIRYYENYNGSHGITESNLHFLTSTIQSYQNIGVSQIAAQAMHQDQIAMPNDADIQKMENQLTAQQKYVLNQAIMEEIVKMSQKVFPQKRILDRIEILPVGYHREYYRYFYSSLINHFLAYRVSVTEFFKHEGIFISSTDGILEKMCQEHPAMQKLPFLQNLIGISFQTASLYRSQIGQIGGHQTYKINQIIADKVGSSNFMVDNQITEFLGTVIENLINNQKFNEELNKAIDGQDSNYLNRITSKLTSVSNQFFKIFWRKQKQQPSYIDRVVALQLALLAQKLCALENEKFVQISKNIHKFQTTVIQAISPASVKVEQIQIQKEKSLCDLLFCCSSARTQPRQ